MFRLISAPPSTAQHRQLLRLRSNLTVNSSPRPCLHSAFFTLQYLDSVFTYTHPLSTFMLHVCLLPDHTWSWFSSLSGCNGSTGSGLLNSWCMLPYFPTTPWVILWLYSAVQYSPELCWAGLGWAGLGWAGLHCKCKSGYLQKQPSVDTGCRLWS